MKPVIKREDLRREYLTPELCHIFELSNSPDDSALSVARARVEPGLTTRWHRLVGTAERYYILAGRGLVEVGDAQPEDVGPGDLVLIPPGCRQRIANTGEEDLVFLALCTPRYRDEIYEDLEAT